MKISRMITGSLATTVAVIGLAAGPALAIGTFQTETNLNLRVCQQISNPQCYVYTVIPKGTSIELNCWAPGTAVNGNTVWYDTYYNGYNGMVAGDYMNTGHDPNPRVSRCG